MSVRSCLVRRRYIKISACLAIAAAVAWATERAQRWTMAERQRVLSADRGEPRHRPRHGEDVQRRGLARADHLAPSVRSALPVGGRGEEPHPARPGRHRPRAGGDAAAARHRRRRTGCADQQRRGLAETIGRREDRRAGDGARRLAAHLQRELLRLRGAGAGSARAAGGGARDGGEHDLHRRLAGASVRLGGVCRIEGGALGADPRTGGGSRDGPACG